MEINQKIIEKIKKLFNLAQNNPNDNESQSALLQAQRLMAENDIEQSQVDQKVVDNTKEVVHENLTSESKIVWYKKSLAYVIAENFRCKNYIQKGYGGGLMFLGLKDDVELAKMVFEFASESIEYGANAFVKKYKSNYYNYSVGIKNDYLQGWINGLSAQYKEQVNKNGWGLVLVKNALVVQEIEKMNFRKGQGSSHNSSGNNKARETGFQHGKSFSSNKRIG